MNERRRQEATERARDEHPKAQFAAAAVEGINQLRESVTRGRLEQQDEALRQALDELQKVREFVKHPENILGSAGTKHGEIAEMVEVHGRNARDLLHGRPLSASEATGRFAPEDYFIDGTAVQSKFVNGLNNNLDSLRTHLDRYPTWGEGGEYFHIPLDHHAQIREVLNGENPRGFSQRTLDAINEKVADIERRTGKSFEEVVRPSESEYPEVMPGKIDATLDGREQDLRKDNEGLKEGIRERGAPSLGEGAKAATTAAVIVGGITFAAGVYQKWREGKNPFHGEFTGEDWREIGVASGGAAATAGVSVFGIYCLTNFAKVAAPLAGAYVSAAASVLVLARSCQAGEISPAELAELAPLACIDAAAVALAAAAGQTLVPIPVVGALLGATAARMCLSILPDKSSYLEAKARLEDMYARQKARIDATESEVIKDILAEYDRLGNLTEAAFDFSHNRELLLLASVHLAEAHRVPRDQILQGPTDLDAYMLE